MLELAFTACLITTGQCEDRSLLFTGVTQQMCERGPGAQIQLAQWEAEHPGWFAQNYTCRMVTGERET